MDYSEVYDTSLLCRLCSANLMECAESYLIDSPLEDLIDVLTTINFDHLSDKSKLALCSNCNDCINAFHQFKCNAISTHEKLREQELAELCEEAAADEEEEEAVGIDQYEIEEITDEQDGEIVEYISADDGLTIDEIEEGNSEDDDDMREEINDEMEDEGENDIMETESRKLTLKEESDYAVENILSEIDEGNYIGDETTKTVARRTLRKLETSVEKEKGKEIYQKLLQKCPICTKMIEKNRLEGHINKHNNHRPFKCSACDKTFYCKQLLRLHKTSIHTDIKVKCETCNKFFPSSRALYAHNLRHRNQDKYVCELCDKKFNNSNSLKRHLAIHSGVRDFVCTTCGVGFYRKFNLDVHVKNVHHQTKEFSCSADGCKKSFGYARLLKDHVKKHHPEQKYDSSEF